VANPSVNHHMELIDGHIEPLTTRETEVLNLMAQGMSSRHIAARLGISYATVRSHIRSVGSKLGAHSKDEAIGKARQLALIS
jgi:DNA-binding NarL/FixJ family response regulator